MEIKPSDDVLKALGALPTERVAAKPRVAPPEPAKRARLERAEAPVKAEASRAARFYRPGALLDIYV